MVDPEPEDRARLQDRLIAAEQDERRRIALFLHDGPVQNLSGIALMLDAVAAAIEAGKLEDASRVLQRAAERQRLTIRELRDLSFALEPVVLRDQGFGPAFRELAEQQGIAHQVQIDLDVAAGDRLGEKAQVALYTILRESLELAIRRGPPTRIAVAIRELDDGSVETCVSDDAPGERRRRAFEAIEERVRQLHGTIAMEAGADGGTVLRVILPPYTASR
jgi:two-component system sensor histidine kinase DegS